MVTWYWSADFLIWQQLINIICMPNIKDICCNPRLHDLVLAGWLPCCATSFVVRRRRWAHVPVIHAASHFDHKERVPWVPISIHTCGSFFYNYGAPFGGPSGRWSSAISGKKAWMKIWSMKNLLSDHLVESIRHLFLTVLKHKLRKIFKIHVLVPTFKFWDSFFLIFYLLPFFSFSFLPTLLWVNL